jgi:hypothetical protein
MTGISSKLPLALDPIDGIQLNKTLIDVVRQNFIMLLLTNPGERVMIPEYGIGLETFLFENDNDLTRQSIEARIRAQANRFLDYITIRDVRFITSNEVENLDRNFMNIKITYQINPLNFVDNLAISPNFEEKLVNIETVVNGEIIKL